MINSINDEHDILYDKKVNPMQRHSLADLFLDNLEYNGGTTGLDAYWAGVPILSAPAEKVVDL